MAAETSAENGGRHFDFIAHLVSLRFSGANHM